MKFYFAAAMLFVVCSAPALVAQQTSKTMRATGRVISVSADSITLRPGSETLTVSVDSSTRVTGKGVGTKVRAMKADNKAPQVSDLVAPNDSVVVEYRDSGSGALLATRIDVRVKAFSKKEDKP